MPHFNNIGRKIRDFVPIHLIIGILMSIFGIFTAVLTSYILYGFGKLIDDVCDISFLVDNYEMKL